MDLRAVAGLSLLGAAAGCRGRSADTAQVPPSIRYEQHVSAGSIAPAAGTLTNPYAQDRGSVVEGERTFEAMHCDGCHGAGAVGFAGPSLVDGRWRYGGTDGALFQSIFYGRARGMPAYGGVLSSGAIWKIVTWLRAQPIPADVPTERWK